MTYDLTTDNVGWCIIEEAEWQRQEDYEIITGLCIFWIMYRENNDWYPYGNHRTYQKAKRRLDEMLDEINRDREE